MSTHSLRPKALFFDVFGTVVNWRHTVIAHLSSQSHSSLASPTSHIPASTRSKAAQTSWSSFAQDWRTSYMTFTASYDPSTSQYKTIDEHHHDSLKELLRDYELGGLWSEEEVRSISRIWHYLDLWPDSSEGLAALNELGFQTSTLSNGNTSLLTDLCKHADLPFTTVTSAEEFGAYKPHVSVYLGACQKLGFEPSECGLVAAHLGDLRAASGCGLRTVYVERAEEEAWSVEKVRDAKEEGWVDVWVAEGEGRGGILEVARRFEAGL